MWDPRAGRWQTPPDATASPSLVVMDSWLVDEGRVRGLERHRERFTATAGPVVGEAACRVFLDAAVAALPRAGAWFPRVELTEGGDLRLWLRPAPPLRHEAVVYGTPYVDRRRSPRVKGPDLPMQTRLRELVQAFEADEALLAAPDGTVTEGVWTTPLWWDGEVLCALPRSAPVLESVTRALLLEAAGRLGVDVGRDTPSLARLRDCETWLVSALHGIRVVTGWLLVPGQAPEPAPVEPGRATAWQHELEALAVPLPGPGLPLSPG